MLHRIHATHQHIPQCWRTQAIYHLHALHHPCPQPYRDLYVGSLRFNFYQSVVLICFLALIVYKIGIVERRSRTAFGGTALGDTSALRRTMHIIIESGLMYSLSVVVFFAVYLASNNAQYGVSDCVSLPLPLFALTSRLNVFPQVVQIIVRTSVVTPRDPDNILYEYFLLLLLGYRIQPDHRPHRPRQGGRNDIRLGAKPDGLAIATI